MPFAALSSVAARLCLAGLVLAAPMVAAEAATPALTLVGEDAAKAIDLSVDDLGAMPQVTIRTETEFSDGVISFRGPLAEDVLKSAGLDDLPTVRFTAANDYFVDIPTDDLRTYHAILAIEADGARLSRREKGPIWLMYPISDFPALQDPVYLRRLIWQVIRIEAP